LFAVNLFDTREISTTPEVTPIPNAPSCITGMIDLRGVIITIIDLRVIVLDATVSKKKIGILVDDVYSVTTYNKSDINQESHSFSENQ